MMHPVRPIAAFTFLGCAAAAAMAHTAPVVEPGKGDAPAAAKKQCRRAAAPTGSIMPGRRTCHTPAEWAAIDAQAVKDNGGDAGRRLMPDPGMSSIPTGVSN